MENRIFDGKEIPVFEWSELNGKTLKMFCYKDNEAMCVGGIDIETKAVYILHTEVIQ